MTAVPTLETARLLVRPFTQADASAVRELAGVRRVAEMTLNIPHPYPEGLAERWIAEQGPAAAEGRSYTFAIARRDDGALLGGIGITIEARHRRAEIGYWLGVPFWNRGYMTEAARRVVAFGFADLGLHRIQATCLPRNPASARVMEHCGMQREGLLRDYICKDGVFEDLLMYGVVESRESKGTSPGAAPADRLPASGKPLSTFDSRLSTRPRRGEQWPSRSTTIRMPISTP